MVLLSFYWIEQRRDRRVRRHWIHSIDDYPDDWLDLKYMLEEVMKTVYVMHKQTEALISLERHMPGKSFEPRYYRGGRIPYKREYEGIFKLEFNPKMWELTVKQASFNYPLNHVREDYWRMERGIQYRTPPLIPKRYQNILGDPRSLLREMSELRYADYSRKPNPTYAYANERARLTYSYPERRLQYDRPSRRLYDRERENE